MLKTISLAITFEENGFFLSTLHYLLTSFCEGVLLGLATFYMWLVIFFGAVVTLNTKVTKITPELSHGLLLTSSPFL